MRLICMLGSFGPLLMGLLRRGDPDRAPAASYMRWPPNAWTNCRDVIKPLSRRSTSGWRLWFGLVMGKS